MTPIQYIIEQLHTINEKDELSSDESFAIEAAIRLLESMVTHHG